MEGDERVLSYGDVLLRRSDVDLLLRPEFLNDRIIDFYFTFLSGQEDSEGSSPLLLVSPSTSYWIMKCPDVGDLVQVIKPLKLWNRQLVLLPVNDNDDVGCAGGIHWSLLVYQRGWNVFLHFDSHLNMNEGHARVLCERVRHHLGGAAACAPFCQAATPQQENGYDCGVYVMAIAKSIKETFEEKRTDLVEAVKRDVNASSVANLRRTTFETIQSLRSGSSKINS